MFGQQDTRIYIIERDIYARQAMVSYLSWDRRTRVIGQSSVPHELIASIKSDPAVANLDVVILDDSLAVHPTGLAGLIKLILFHAPEAAIICLTRDADPERILAAGRAGARAYLSREHVGIGLASAVHFTNWHQFVITQDLTLFGDKLCQQLDLLITLLPERRFYSRLTQRVEQALWLCVVEGLPAERAAEEMGVSVSTIRSYVKEGYRILEAEDDTIYPPGMSPAERAFLRFSALEIPEHCLSSSSQQPAA